MNDDDGTIQIRDERGDQRFAIDNAIFDVYGPIIGPYGLAMYMALCRYANKSTQQCYPHVKTLMVGAGMSYVKAHDALRKLCEVGLIKRDSGKEAGTGNTYTLLQVHDDPDKQREFALKLGYIQEEGGVRVVNRVEGVHYANTGCSQGEQGCSPDEQGCISGEQGYSRSEQTSEQPNLTTESNNRTEQEGGAPLSRAPARASPNGRDGPNAELEPEKPKTKRARSPAQREQDDMCAAIAEVCFNVRKPEDFDLLPGEEKRNIRVVARQFREAGRTPDEVRDFWHWWRREDWRGQRGERPTLRQLKAEWKKARTRRSYIEGEYADYIEH